MLADELDLLISCMRGDTVSLDLVVASDDVEFVECFRSRLARISRDFCDKKLVRTAELLAVVSDLTADRALTTVAMPFFFSFVSSVRFRFFLTRDSFEWVLTECSESMESVESGFLPGSDLTVFSGDWRLSSERFDDFFTCAALLGRARRVKAGDEPRVELSEDDIGLIRSRLAARSFSSGVLGLTGSM